VRQGLNLKRYPLRYTHTGPSTLRSTSLSAQPNDRPTRRVFTGNMQFIMLRNEQPQNAFEVKLGIPFVIASALVKRNVGLA
jgi:hypothetical protein